MDHYGDYAHFCRALHQSDPGRRSRQLAGLHDHVPGEDDLGHFRSRVGEEGSHQTLAEIVALLRAFGLITGALWSSDGQLESSYARYTGCPYAREGCHAFPLNEAHRQALGAQLPSGAKRLQSTCPFPDVVAKGREATAKKATPKDPPVSLIEIEGARNGSAANSDRQQRATLLALPQDEVPPVPLKRCHVSRGPQGELLGTCPKGPADLEATVGYHVDNKNPSEKEAVFGYVHLKTTDVNCELALELPLGASTSPAATHEGSALLAHRTALAMPVLPGQVHLGDAAYEVTANDLWIHDQGGIAVFAYNRRNAHLDPAALVNRGYDQHGTPYAPCGRLCRANGYDYHAQRRQYVCGWQWPPKERRRCPHRFGVLGSTPRMTCKDHPRLIGPIQRGAPGGRRLYAAPSASERTNSYDQEGIAGAPPLRMRGLKALRFAGALRTLAPLLRRALNWVLAVTYTVEKSPVAPT